MRFPIGHLLATPAVIEHLTRNSFPYLRLVLRHMNGDWGELEAGYREVNERAVMNGEGVLSAYDVAGAEIHVYTESDRSYTSVLLASEFLFTD